MKTSQAPESSDPMKAAISLMKLLAQGEKDVSRGRMSGQDEVFKRLEEKLTAGKERKKDE